MKKSTKIILAGALAVLTAYGIRMSDNMGPMLPIEINDTEVIDTGNTDTSENTEIIGVIENITSGTTESGGDKTAYETIRDSLLEREKSEAVQNDTASEPVISLEPEKDNTEEGVTPLDPDETIDESASEVEAEITVPVVNDEVIETETSIEESNVEGVNSSSQITAEDMLITEDTNTRDHEYVTNKISINNADGFGLSEDTNAKILQTIKNTGKRVSFYITDPETNATISYNANEKMQPASSIKAGMSLVACKMVDTGQLDLDQEYEYQGKHYKGGSGTIQYDPIGTKYTLREIIHRTINVSDNIGYMMLIDIVGRDRYNKFVTDLGCDNTLESWQTNGYMSAHDLNLIWQEIYQSDRLAGEELYSIRQAGVELDESKYSACAILNYELLDAKYNFLANCLPYKSSHKSGFSGGSYNDSGVIYTDYGNYIVTIMTNGNSSANSYNFNSVGRAINNAIIEYSDYKLEKEQQEDISNKSNVEMEQ